MDIEQNIQEYTSSQGTQPLERYASFDYCFNYFQSFRDKPDELASERYMQESCLQLGFYLASWGMYRKGFLRTRSMKIYEPLIQQIASADRALWDIDAHCYTSLNIDLIFEFGGKIRSSLFSKSSNILVTKIMLGVFGNIPAFDTYFTKGFGSSFTRRALDKVGKFYIANASLIDKHRLPTFDFSTGQLTNRLYTRAKVIDMLFFIEGRK
jgi:hypothetical protein